LPSPVYGRGAGGEGVLSRANASTPPENPGMDSCLLLQAGRPGAIAHGVWAAASTQRVQDALLQFEACRCPAHRWRTNSYFYALPRVVAARPGKSVMMLSAPKSARRRIRAGSLTVQTETCRPCCWALSRRSGVHSV